MKILSRFFFVFVLIFWHSSVFAQGTGADSLRLRSVSGGSAWLSIPTATVANYRLLLPSSLGTLSSQIAFVNGATGQMSLLSPGNNGELLRISAGSLAWINPDTLLSTTGWALRGNAGTSPSLNFVGTTDAQPLRFATNGSERIRILSNGRVGFGLAAPIERFHMVGGNLFIDTTSSGTASELRMANPLGTFYSSFKAGAQIANLSYTWPTSAPTAGQVLTSDASGLMSWSTALTGSTGWSLSGNATASAWNGTTGNFLGTTSTQPLSIATTNATAQDIRFYTGVSGANERMRISSTGNVGIGTSGAPGYTFEVNGPTFYLHNGATPYIYASNSGSNVGIGMSSSPASTLSVGGNATIGYNIAAPANGMIVQGNVGIGTSSPTLALDVKGSGRFAGGSLLIDTSASGTAGQLQLMNPARTFRSNFAAGAQAANITYTLPLALPTNNGVLQTTNAGTMSWTDLGAGNSIVSTPGGVATRVAFWSGATTLTSNANLYWDNTNSRLGIGTASPTVPLTIVAATNSDVARFGDGTRTVQISAGNWGGMDAGWIGTFSNHPLSFNTNNSASQMVLSTAGNLGIGTLTPNAPLQLSNSVVNRKIVLYESANNDHQFYGLGINSSTLRYQVADVANSHVFYAGTSTSTSNELMRITGSAAVGIGGVTPVSTLQVNSGNAANSWLTFTNNATSGTTASDGFVVGLSSDLSAAVWNRENSFIQFGTNSLERMRLSATGDLGIGLTTPASKLHVDNGTATASYLTVTNGATSGQSSGDGLVVGLSASAGATVWNRESTELTFGTSGTERMRIESNGRVGIGTSSPSVGVHYINDNAIFSSSNIQTQNVSNYFSLANLNNASYELRIQEPNGSGTNYSALKSPVQSYDMTYTFPQTVPSATQLLQATSITGSAGAGYNISLSWVNASGGAGATGVRGTGVPGEVAFWTTDSIISSDSRLYWDDGLLRLGVGTNTPDEKVDVEGNLIISNGNSLSNELRIAEPYYTGGNQNYSAFTSQAQTENILYRLPAAIPAASAYGTNRYALATDESNDTLITAWQTFWSPSGNAGTSAANAFLGTTDNQALVIRTNNTEKARIGTDGQLSLRNGSGAGAFTLNQQIFGWGGTSDYQYSHALKTRHNGGAPTDNAIDFYLWNQGTDATATVGTKHGLTIDGASGTANVGIGGISSPHANIHLPTITANRKIIAYEVANNDHQFFGLGVNSGAMRYQVDATTSNHIFYAGTSSSTSNELMRIQGNGFVGIGTSTPYAMLQVYGSTDVALAAANSGLLICGIENGLNITIDNNEIMARNNGVKTGLFVQAEGGDFSLHNLRAGTEVIVKDNGDMGVGIAAPSSRLHVAGGNILIDTSAAGTAAQLSFINPARTFQTNIKAGAQSANITYVLPTAAPSAGQLLQSDASGNMSWFTNPTTLPLSSLTAATATNTINNVNNAQTWQWNSLAGISAMSLSSNSTAAAANAQTLFNIALSGANATASQTTYGQQTTNTHTGTSSTNVAGYFSASGGTNNYGLLVANGNVGIGTTTPTAVLHVNGAHRNSGGHILLDTLSSGTAAQFQFMNPARTFQTNIRAGAQAANITYTLPTTAPSAGQFMQSDASGNLTWASASTTTALSSLTAATGTNTIDNASHAQTWQWNTLASASAITLSSSSTAAAANTQTLLNIALSGANATASQTTYGLQSSNTHTGSSSTNIGGYFSASGGTNNYGLIVAAGDVGIGTTTPIGKLNVHTNSTASQIFITTNTNVGSANDASLFFQSDNDGTQNPAGLGQFNDGSLRFTGAGSLVSPDMVITDAGRIGIGTTAPSVKFHIKGGSMLLDTTGAAASELRFQNPAGTFYTALKAGANAANVTYTLPTADGSNGFQLTTNGSGTLSWAAAGSGSSSLSSLTLATAINTIDNSSFAQSWQWTTLAGASALSLSSNSTAATGNAQTLLNVSLSGANSNASQTTYGMQAQNTHTGTSATNVGALFSASGGTNNYALLVPLGNVGIGTTTPTSTLHINGSGRLSGGNLLIDTSATATAGQLQMMNPARTFQTNIRAGAQSANITYTLPTSAPTAGQVLQSDASGNLSWSSSAGSPALSSITAATASSTINNANNPQTWQWNTLGGVTGFSLSSNSTAATSNAQTLFSIALSGANATSFQTTYGMQATNTHTGSNSTNIGGYFSASGGVANYGLLVAAGSVGIGTILPTATLHVNGSERVSGGNLLIDTSATSTAGQLQLMNPARTFQTNIQSGAQVANITYTLPTAAPTANGHVLSSSTAGTMAWTDLSTVVSGTQFVKKAADETVSSSAALQNDDELLITQAANQTWEYEIQLHVTTNGASNGGYQFTMIAPAGSTQFFTTSTTTATHAEDVITISGSTNSVATLNSAAANVVKLKGYVSTAGTSGSVTLQWAQATSNANEARVKVGSYVKATRLQ